MSSLILHVDFNYASPYAMSAFVALREKKLDFKIKLVDLDKHEHNQTAYSNASLTGRVPMLQRLICNGDRVPLRLADYAKYQWQREPVQQWFALKRPDFA